MYKGDMSPEVLSRCASTGGLAHPCILDHLPLSRLLCSVTVMAVAERSAGSALVSSSLISIASPITPGH